MSATRSRWRSALAAVFARPFVLEANEHFVTDQHRHRPGRGRRASAEPASGTPTPRCTAPRSAAARATSCSTWSCAGTDDRPAADRERPPTRDRARRAPRRLPAGHRAPRLLDRGLRGAASMGAPATRRDPARRVHPGGRREWADRPIGRWVLERACRQAAAWSMSRPDSAPIGISVNLSPAQLANRGFSATVAKVLGSSGLEPAVCSLEITESVLLEDPAAIADTLVGVKQLGVRIVLDDFGTGYSSLGYLSRLPLDALKVDRCSSARSARARPGARSPRRSSRWRGRSPCRSSARAPRRPPRSPSCDGSDATSRRATSSRRLSRRPRSLRFSAGLLAPLYWASPVRAFEFPQVGSVRLRLAQTLTRMGTRQISGWTSFESG